MPANNKSAAQSKKTAPDRPKDKNRAKDKTPAKAKKKVAKEKPMSPAQVSAQSQAAIDDALDELLRKDPVQSGSLTGTVASGLSSATPLPISPPTSPNSQPSPPNSQLSLPSSNGGEAASISPHDLQSLLNRIQELKAQTNSQPSEPASSSQLGSGIECPEGEAGRSGNGSRPGSKIYKELGFKQNDRAWLDILATGRAGIVRFDLDFNLTWSKQSKRKLYGIAAYIGKQHPDVFPPGRYKDNWAEEEVAHQAFINNRATRLKQQRGVSTGSRHKSSCAQSPPTSNPASDEDDDSKSDNDSQSDDNSQTGDDGKTQPPTAAELKEFREFEKKNHRGRKRPSEAEDGANSRYPKRPRRQATSSNKSATDDTSGDIDDNA
ncbi:hypothetical protein EST38_g14282 [Candolleomyces aberdarensis]|uniref:Uncharacterized protein n=1 Tax=Candolleomyces aberdarensis TaxID=2316362 RepID=A0A4Q2CYU5_9AGAR|nr:hypothetical protein EST38_g14282 [Candolleomyces aberdarensis]